VRAVAKKPVKEKRAKSKRPTREVHSGAVENPKTFQQVFDAVSKKPDKLYRTNAGTPFMCRYYRLSFSRSAPQLREPDGYARGRPQRRARDPRPQDHDHDVKVCSLERRTQKESGQPVEWIDRPRAYLVTKWSQTLILPPLSPLKSLILLVGARGFEPPTP
jgi:hypothetical protein